MFQVFPSHHTLKVHNILQMPHLTQQVVHHIHQRLLLLNPTLEQHLILERQQHHHILPAKLHTHLLVPRHPIHLLVPRHPIHLLVPRHPTHLLEPRHPTLQPMAKPHIRQNDHIILVYAYKKECDLVCGDCSKTFKSFSSL